MGSFSSSKSAPIAPISAPNSRAMMYATIRASPYHFGCGSCAKRGTKYSTAVGSANDTRVAPVGSAITNLARFRRSRKNISVTPSTTHKAQIGTMKKKGIRAKVSHDLQEVVELIANSSFTHG